MGESGYLDYRDGGMRDGWVYKCSIAPAEPRGVSRN